MKRTMATLAMGAISAAAIFSGSAAQQEARSAHRVISPSDIQWGAAPASLPAGAEAAVLYGDPTKEGLFALRVRIPSDYYIPPHTHAKPEVVTVLSGEFRLGIGTNANKGSAQSVGAGAFISIQPEVPHFVFAEKQTILQITSIGPWAIDYIDPKDDPRLNVAPIGKGEASQRGN